MAGDVDIAAIGGHVDRVGTHTWDRSDHGVAEYIHDVQAAAGSIFGNPVDTPNLATPGAISTAVRVLSEAPDIHMIVYHLGFHPISQWGFGRFASPAFLEPVIESFVEATEATGKPVLLALRPPRQLNGMDEFAAAQEAFVKAGLPVFHSLRDGARAMSRAVAWSQASTER